MFAIEINEATLPKIFDLSYSRPIDPKAFDYHLRSSNTWYFVNAFVTPSGRVHEWTIIPWHKLRRDFEHDPVKIQNDWDQIVRK